MEEDKKPEVPGTKDDADLVFYYSREHRLARASGRVRELYEEKPARPRGIFRTLTASRSGAVVLVSIILVSVFIMLTARQGRESPGTTLGDNRIEVSAIGFPANAENEAGSTYVALKKTALKPAAYTGEVDIALSVPRKTGEGDVPIVTERIFFTLEDEEDFRFVLPWNAPELLIVLRGGDTTQSLRVIVD
jgi:hypothetical protein